METSTEGTQILSQINDKSKPLIVDSPDDSSRVLTRLRRAFAACALSLLILTWRLWMPMTDFPQIPLVGWARDCPAWCDWAGYAVMLAAMFAVYVSSQSSRTWRWGFGIYTAALIGMVLINQHRLQPWAYQFALVGIVLALKPGPAALPLLRVLTVGIYFHSALSKLDVSFLDGQGRYLLSGLSDLVGLEFSEFDRTSRRCLAALLPLGELLVAIGLCVRRTRRPALIASVVMHALLIVALGPWALDHKFPVLIWNGYLIAQNVLLFGYRTEPVAGDKHISFAAMLRGTEPGLSRLRTFAAAAVVGMAILLPFLQPFGLFDVWPSWAVYASRPARVLVFVDNDAIGQLPGPLQEHVEMGRRANRPSLVVTGRWSLDVTSAPLYPQRRFQLGVALALAEQGALGERVHLRIQSAADRWTGRRSTRRVSGVQAIRDEADQFWLNALPRNRPEPN